jgi:hypothetical protein
MMVLSEVGAVGVRKVIFEQVLVNKMSEFQLYGRIASIVDEFRSCPGGEQGQLPPLELGPGADRDPTGLVLWLVFGVMGVMVIVLDGLLCLWQSLLQSPHHHGTLFLSFLPAFLPAWLLPLTLPLLTLNRQMSNGNRLKALRQIKRAYKHNPEGRSMFDRDVIKPPVTRPADPQLEQVENLR